jgi:hypothetical protein
MLGIVAATLAAGQGLHIHLAAELSRVRLEMAAGFFHPRFGGNRT